MTVKTSNTNMPDRLDLKILEILQKNGRITNKELATRVNLSSSACHQRLQRLIDDGWLLGFNGQINIKKLCEPVECITTIKLNNHSNDTFRYLENRFAELPEALEAFTVSGTCDFIVWFACSRMSRYVELTDSLIEECSEIVNINTHVVLKQSKVFQGYPLDELL